MKFTTSFAILSALSAVFAAPTLLAGTDALAVVPAVAAAALAEVPASLDPFLQSPIENGGDSMDRRAIAGDVSAIVAIADPLIVGGNAGFLAGRDVAVTGLGPVHSIPDAVLAVEAEVFAIIGKLDVPGIGRADAVALILELVAQLNILKGLLVGLKALNLDVITLLGVDGTTQALALRIVGLIKLILAALLNVTGVFGLLAEIAQVGILLQVILGLVTGLVAGLDVVLVGLLRPVVAILVKLGITLLVGGVRL